MSDTEFEKTVKEELDAGETESLRNKYKLNGPWIVGPNLSVEAAMLVEPERHANVEEGKKIIFDCIVGMLNAAYAQGKQRRR
jgi:hypothetical protein